MSNLGWPWRWKIAFVALGLVLGTCTVAAFADDAAPACVSDDIPGVLALTYDAAGNVEFAKDLQNNANARFEFRAGRPDAVLDDISVTHFIKALPKPDKYGNSELWGPVRWSEYNLKTGDLRLVHVYEKGRQLTFTIPDGTDFARLRDAKTGLTTFTGAPESCDSQYETCKTLEPRSIALTEPLRYDPKAPACLDFAGVKIALKKPDTTVAGAPDNGGPTEEQDPSVTVKPIPGGHQTCLPEGCITVYDDAPGAPDNGAQGGDETQTPAN